MCKLCFGYIDTYNRITVIKYISGQVMHSVLAWLWSTIILCVNYITILGYLFGIPCDVNRAELYYNTLSKRTNQVLTS